MFESVAAFDGDSTMIRVLLVDEVLSAEDFDGDLRAEVFEVFEVFDEVDFDDEDFVPAFEVFDDDDATAFLIRGGAFVSDSDKLLAVFDSCDSDSKTAFIFFANDFFFASSFFGEDSFLTGMIITPICIF